MRPIFSLDIETPSSESLTGVPRRIMRFTCSRNRRTLLTKILLAAAAIVFFGSVVALISLAIINHRLKDQLLTASNSMAKIKIQEELEICITTECIEAAARILTDLDVSIDPCDDMARFACSGWVKQQARTADTKKDIISFLGDVQDKIDLQLKLMLEAPTKPDELKANQKVRQYYSSCMDERNDQARNASVKKAIDELGSISAPSEWNSSQWNLTDLIGRILQHNGAPFFDLIVQIDDRNTSRYVLAVTLPRQSGIMPEFHSPIPRDLLHVLKTTEEYGRHGHRSKRQFVGVGSGFHDELPSTSYPELQSQEDPLLDSDLPYSPILQVFLQLSRDMKSSSAIQLTKSVGAFSAFGLADFEAEESAILELMRTIDRLLPSYREKKLMQPTTRILNYYTVDRLQQTFSFIDWQLLFRIAIGKSLSPDTEIVVHYPKILLQIQAIVNEIEPRILHNSLLMFVVRDLALELFKVPPGLDKWSFCVQAAKVGFSEALSRMYLETFTRKSLETYHAEAEDLFIALKASIVDIIKRSSWPDPITKSKALSKARTLKSNLVTSSIYFNDTFIEEMAATANTDGLDFVAGTLQLYRIFRRQFFDFYSRPVDETAVTWQLFTDPMTVNAFHIRDFNSIVLPLGLLQDELFSMKLPKYLGLGGLGFIVAHEIMHAFDDSGIEFDENGIRNSLLSSPSTRRVFQEKMSCVSHQYSNSSWPEYSVNGTHQAMKVDGNLTLNEDVADIGAAKAIVATLTRLDCQNGPDPYLPGLTKYTHEQTMLINAAQTYCSVMNPWAYVAILGMDEHAPPHARVNGFMMNLPDFGRIFSCPVGSRMNPETKCSVW